MASNKKTPGKPKREGKKKNAKRVPPLRAGLRPKKEKLFRLKLWRTYESEVGPKIRLIRKDSYGDYYGELQLGAWSPVWTPNGQPWLPNGATARTFGALVREVKRRGK